VVRGQTGDSSAASQSEAPNSPALASAYAALPAAGGCIDFPAGRYLFSTAVTLTYPTTGIYSVSLVGAGADNTTLYFPGSNGVTINAQNGRQTIHVRDLTFSTGSAGGYTALILNNAVPLNVIMSSDVFRTDFRGDDGGMGTDYWYAGVYVAGQSNINFDSDTFFGNAGTSGTGIFLNGNTGVTPYWGIVYNIAKCGFFWVGNGLAIGTYIQGVTVTQSNFTNGTTGIFVLSGGSGLTEIAITGGNQFNTAGNQIVIDSPVNSLIMNGNLIYVSENNSGLLLNAMGGQHSIVNNVFSAGNSTGTAGIYVGYSNAPAVVT
jgi:hypothetical protein